jgi:type II secretory pathway predicted ATPase ExeA
MWESFFGFKKTPFSDSPDAKQLFASQAWSQVKTRLEFLAQHHGVGLVTGEVGAGKSTAARVFTPNLNASLYKILYVHSPPAPRWTCYARSLWNWTWNRRTSAATWCARLPAPSCA